MINLTIIDKFLKFPYSFEKTLAPLVIFFLVFYGGYAAPKLPDLIVSLFENPIFRIFILSLIVYKGNSNPSIAILISVGFTVVMDRINKQSITENFNNRIENFNNRIENFSNKLEDIGDDKLEVDKLEGDKLEGDKLEGDKLEGDKLEGDKLEVDKLEVDKQEVIHDNNLEIDNSIDDDDDFIREDICNGMCSKINYNDFEGKIKSDEFSQEYFNTIKDCMVVDLLQNKSNNEVNHILKKMDLTHNDIDGPIGTAYVNYTDAVSRLNL